MESILFSPLIIGVLVSAAIGYYCKPPLLGWLTVGEFALLAAIAHPGTFEEFVIVIPMRFAVQALVAIVPMWLVYYAKLIWRSNGC